MLNDFCERISGLPGQGGYRVVAPSEKFSVRVSCSNRRKSNGSYWIRTSDFHRVRPAAMTLPEGFIRVRSLLAQLGLQAVQPREAPNR